MRLLAKTILVVAMILALVAPAMASGEKHQAVRGVRAEYDVQGSMSLNLTLLLGNGDVVKRTYKDEEIAQVTELLKLASQQNVALYVNLSRSKKIEELFIEFGSPIPFNLDD